MPVGDPLTASQKQALEGIYSFDVGSNDFGPMGVVKWNSREYMTVLTEKDISYFVLRAGQRDSVFFFEGYWQSQNSRRSGRASFRVPLEGGGRRLMGDSSVPSPVLLEGTVDEGEGGSSSPVVLRYRWPVRREVLERKFWVLAHRGGGKMSDPLPYSENSVELILVSERYGANGIEIDVRLTKDGVPILYHDNTLNARLVQKTPMLGPVEEYTFPQLRTSVRLLRGELIPSLEEAFNAVVYRTNLKLVWLDLKTEGRDLISRIVPLVQEYTMQAAVLAEQGLRDTLEIMLGVPSDAIYDEILRYPSYTSLPTIAERSLDKARTLHSLVWAPVWSSGICRADNATARSEGRRIFVWTLDDPHFTQEYVDSFEYDGILSDYPMIVAYYHYVQ